MSATSIPDADSPPAPIWRHALAMLYDSLLIIPLFMAMSALWVSIWGPVDSIYEQSVPPGVVWTGWAAILICFFGAFWRRGGQTLGMQAWRIKLTSDSGSRVTWKQVIIRLLGAVVSLAAFGLGFFWKLVPPGNKYWHDSLSATHLELVPKPE